MSDDDSSHRGHRGCAASPALHVPLSCLGTCPHIISIFTVIIITTILESFNTGIAPGICILHSCALHPLQKLSVVLLLRPSPVLCPAVFLFALCTSTVRGSSQCFSWHRFWPHILFPRASLKAQLVKDQPAMQKTPVQLLCRENPLEKG